MNRNQLIGLAIALVVLFFTGILPNLWLVVGLIALIWLWNFLVTQFTGARRLINWGLGLLVAFSVISAAGWNIYKNYVQPGIPETRDAISRAGKEADLDAALRINPAMFKSRLEVAAQLQWLQDRIGERHAVELADIRKEMNAGRLTPEAAWTKTREILAEEKSFNDKTRQDVSTLLGKTNDQAAKPIGSWPWRLVALGAILLAAVMFIPVKFALPGKKLLGLIGAIALMAGLVFVFFPEITSGVKDLGDRPAARPATAAVAAYATQLPANAKFVKILAPGEKIYVTRANMDAAPPKFWAKFNSGFVETFDSWPQAARHRFAFNNTSQSYAFYIALAPEQSFSASTADPTLVAKADQQASADCSMDQVFGPK